MACSNQGHCQASDDVCSYPVQAGTHRPHEVRREETRWCDIGPIGKSPLGRESYPLSEHHSVRCMYCFYISINYVLSYLYTSGEFQVGAPVLKKGKGLHYNW